MSYLETEINYCRKQIEKEENRLDIILKENEQKEDIIKELQDRIESKTHESKRKFWLSEREKGMGFAVEISRLQDRLHELLHSKKTSEKEIDVLKRDLQKHKKELEEKSKKVISKQHPKWKSFPEVLDQKIKEKFLDLLYDMVEIPDVRNVDYVNIVLIGEVGSGKSSFINTCRTAVFNKGAIFTTAKVLPSASESVTKKLFPYPLRNSAGKLLPVRLFDCCGMSKEIEEDEMELILKGYIKPNSHIQAAEKMKKNKEIYRVNPETKDKMHCVVTVIRADSNLMEETGCFVKIKNICDQMRTFDYNPFVLLTSIDRIGVPNAEMKHLFSYPCVKRICQTVAEKLNLPLPNVLPMSNYFEEGLPTPEKDALALMYLWRFISSGKEILSLDPETSVIPDNFYD